MMKTPRRTAAPTVARGLLVAACLGAMTGCTTVRNWFTDDEESASAPAALKEIPAAFAVATAWKAGVGKGEADLGLRQGPAVDGGRVFVAAVKGGVRALDLQSGRVAWQAPVEGVRLSSGPGVGDGLVVVGGLEGEVVALDQASGAEKWRAKVGNEVVAAPAIAQGRVFVRANDGRVTAFDAATGERRWFWNRDMPALTARGNDAVSVGPGVVFVGNDDGTVAMLAVADGRPLWELPVAEPEGRTELDRMADVDGTPVLEGGVLVATSFKRRTVAIDAPNGQPIWSAEQGGPGRPAVGTDRVVVTDADGGIHALEKQSGGSMWQQPGLARRRVTAPVIAGDHAVVADFEGYVHWLRLDSGAFAARQRVGGAVKATPIVADGLVIVQTVEGDVVALRPAQ